MKNLKNTIILLAGSLMILCSLGGLMQGHLLAALFLCLGGLVCIPRIRLAFENRFRLQTKRWHRYALVIGCWCAASALMSKVDTSESPSEPITTSMPSAQSLLGSVGNSLDSSQRDTHAHGSYESTHKPKPTRGSTSAPVHQSAKKAPNEPKPTPKPAPKPQPKPQPKPKRQPRAVPMEDGGGCTYRGHPLNVGPRGGCYYWAGNSKEYVDRSLCAGCR